MTPSESEGPAPVEVAVQCRGRIFAVKVVDENGEPLTAPELQIQFQNIRDKCDKEPEGPGLGALTGDNRTTWAQVRHVFWVDFSNKINTEILCYP